MCLKRKEGIQSMCADRHDIWMPNMGCHKGMQERLRTTQRIMDRVMLGITKRDRKTNVWVKKKTDIQNIITSIKALKWQWAGHIARQGDNRWTKIVTEWIPLGNKRKRARPKTRWQDDIVKSVGITWMRKAQDRSHWKHHEEAFIQQWI